MKSKPFQQHVSVAAAVAAILGGVVLSSHAPTARAQEASSSNEITEVVVTGSRIVRRDLTSSSPLITVDTAALEQRSGLNVESYLNQLPAFNPAAAPTLLTGSGSNSDVQISAVSSVGISAISLRGLGPNRTLTLIDGRRAVPNNANMVVDVNSIPSSMIKRVDIISGGASAVYGADAMGGVSNFILRKDFEGLEVDAQYGGTEAGDGQEIRGSAIMGTKIADGRGHIVVATEYYDRQAAFQKNRDFWTNAWADPNVPGNFLGFVFGANGYYSYLNPPNPDTAAAINGGSPGCGYLSSCTRSSFRFNNNGSVFFPVGPNVAQWQAGGGILDGATWTPVNIYDTTGNTFSAAVNPSLIQQVKYNETEQYASSPQTRYSLMASGEFEINDHVKFFSDARYAQSKTRTYLAGTNASYGWETTIPYNAATDSPVSLDSGLDFTNPETVQNILANCNQFTCNAGFANAGFVPHGAAGANHPVPVQLAILLNSRGADAGDPLTTGWIAETYPFDSFPRRQTVDTVQAFQIETGVSFDIPVKDWTGEVYYSRGESTTYSVATGNNSLARWRGLTQAADYGYHSALQSNSDGASPNFGSVAVPCTSGFFDTLFSGDAKPTDDCLYAVGASLQTRAENQQDVVEFNTQGGLFNLPAGEVRAALGYQFRRNSSQFNPDILQSTASFTDQVIGVYPTGYLDASTTVHDYFGEFIIPVLGGYSWLKKLELNLGARESDYNKTKDTFTWKANATVEINDSLMFRGGFNRATRAPNLGEMFLNLQQVFGGGGTYGDPCGLISNSPFGAGGAVANPFPTGPASLLAAGQTPEGAMSTYLICRAQMGAGADNFYSTTTAQPAATGAPFAWNNQQGNPDLRSETADTVTAGFVLNSPWENPWAKSLSLTMDYYRIEMKDVIEPYSVDYARYLCYGQVTVTNPTEAAAQAATQACQDVPRSTGNGGALTQLLRYSNQASVDTAGVDVTFNWFGNLADLGLESVPGGIGFNVTGTYLDKYITRLSPANFDVPIDWKGSLGPQVPGFNNGAYDFRLISSLSYTLPNMNFSLRWRFFPTVDTFQQAQERGIRKNNARVAAGGDGITLSYTPTTLQSIPSYSTFDFSFNWNVSDTYSVRAGVDNIFDKDAPITNVVAGYPASQYYDGSGVIDVCHGAPGCQNPTSYSLPSSAGIGQFPTTNGGYYDTLGRRYYVGVKATF
jgi:outer membrane receptor protein involved in Fe transport